MVRVGRTLGKYPKCVICKKNPLDLKHISNDHKKIIICQNCINQEQLTGKIDNPYCIIPLYNGQCCGKIVGKNIRCSNLAENNGYFCKKCIKRGFGKHRVSLVNQNNKNLIPVGDYYYFIFFYKICIVEDCKEINYYRGLCAKHYNIEMIYK